MVVSEDKRGRGRPPLNEPPAVVEPVTVTCRVLTVKAFGAAIGLSESSVLKLIEAGQVKFIANLYGGKRIPIEEVDAYLRRNLKEIRPRAEPQQEAKGQSKPPALAARGVAVGPDGVSRMRRRG